VLINYLAIKSSPIMSNSVVLVSVSITAHLLQVFALWCFQDERPFTCAGSYSDNLSTVDRCPGIVLGGQKLEISLIANWGHSALIGSKDEMQ
jgi:hypothetical protein